jgi:signal transduction histidine kinase
MDQRDEALRELLAQLTVANLAALAIASLVGYRLARAALQPVERYRARAEQIAAGATGVRLDVPLGVDDEVSRLGHTLNAMLAEQERAADRQQQFIDDASHELRTPLTVLAAEIDVALRRHRSADEYEQTLRRIAVSTGRLVQLADDLLALGAQGAEAPTFCPLYAADLLDEVADRARALLGAAPSRPVRTDAPLGLVVSADRALLARALGNAVDNAVRYGDGSITLTAAPLTGDAASGVVLAVHDDGPGMPADFLPHAAERFRQAQRSRTGPGSGLGLSLVDAIAAAHRGQLRICSNGRHHGEPAGDPGLAAAPCRHPAAGTTASLLLPTRPVPDRALPTAGERIAPVGG